MAYPVTDIELSARVVINPIQASLQAVVPEQLALQVTDIVAIALPAERQYSGAYTVTPTQETQILPTSGKTLTRNVVINPIPSNYGLITYNGFGLTVS